MKLNIIIKANGSWARQFSSVTETHRAFSAKDLAKYQSYLPL